jgi:hypothetical protein
MSGMRLRPIAAHFVVALLATFIAAAGALFARAAVVAVEIAEARALTPVIVRVTQPADWDSVARAAALLSDMDGVALAAPMSPERAAALLRQAGSEVSPDQLPAFYMVEAEIEGRISDPKTRLRDALAKDGILVEVDASPPAPSPPVREAAWGGALLAVTLGLALLWLAARAQAQIASAAAIINADIGAPLGRTLFAYGRSGALFGFRAGIIGTGLAAVCAIAAIMAPRGAPSLGDLWPLLGRTEFLMLCAGPLLAALAAASGARAGGAQAHRKAERVG